MAAKKSTDVMIAGKVYTLSGYEEEGYLQRVASYINARISEITEREEFRRIPNDLKSILIELNIADDYFKAKDQYEEIESNYKKTEKDLFNLKHELVDAQMKAEEFQTELKSEQKKNAEKNNAHKELEKKYQQLEAEKKEAEERFLQLEQSHKEAEERFLQLETEQKGADEKRQQSEAVYQKLEADYKELEEKYQQLSEDVRVSQEKNRQFEEILRLNEKEKQDLKNENKELRMNKEKLEAALGDALLGARKQDAEAAAKQKGDTPDTLKKTPESDQAITLISEEDDPELAELARQIEELEREEGTLHK